MKSTVFAGRWVVAGLLFLSLLTTGCPPPVTARPVWLYSREYQSYPAAQFLVGVGKGPTREHARKNARDDLQGQLKINIEQAVKTAREKCVAGSWFDPFVHRPGLPPDLPLPVIGEEWNSADDEQHAALAVWERKRLASYAANYLMNAGQEAMRAGSHALKQGDDHYRALKSYLQALDLRSKAETGRVIVSASLPPSSADYSCSPPFRAITDEIDNIVSGIKFLVVYGDGQRVGSDGGLADSLTVAVRYVGSKGPVPVNGMPVVFETGTQKGIKTVTFELGLASVDISKGLEAGNKTIDVRPDAGVILGDAGISANDKRFESFIKAIEKPHARFRYLKAGETRSRVLVAVTECVRGLPAQDSMVASELRKQLKKSGYFVVSRHELPEAYSELTELDQLVEAMKEHVELVIYGRLNADVTEEVAKNFVFAETSGKLQVAVVAKGEVIYSHDSPVKGAGLDVYSATDRAYSSLSRKIVPALMSAIKKHSERNP